MSRRKEEEGVKSWIKKWNSLFRLRNKEAKDEIERAFYFLLVFLEFKL